MVLFRIIIPAFLVHHFLPQPTVEIFSCSHSLHWKQVVGKVVGNIQVVFQKQQKDEKILFKNFIKNENKLSEVFL
jgi:hypothetical protein